MISLFALICKEFLKKEFSQENIEFWVKCENFKTISNAIQVSWKKELVEPFATKTKKQLVVVVWFKDETGGQRHMEDLFGHIGQLSNKCG